MTAQKRWSKTEQPRRLLCFSAAFCLCCLVFALAYSRGWPAPLFWPACTALLLGAAAGLWLRRRALLLLAGLGCGLLWAAGFWLLALSPAEKWQGKGAEMRVELTARAVGYTTYGTAEGRLLSLNGKPARGRVFLYLSDGSPELEPGSRIAFTGTVLQAKRLPEGLFWAARQEGPLVLDTPAAPSWRAGLARASGALGKTVDKLLDGDEGGLVKALLCGDRTGMSRELCAALRVSGLSHIAAVSGMHLSVLSGFACMLLGKRWGSAAALPLVLLYAGITGFSPSVVRAAVMVLLATAGFFMRRESDPLTSLFAALLVLAAHNPFSLLSPSLLLSFSATLGILLFAPALTGAVSIRTGNRLRKKAASALVRCAAVSLAATACATPVTLIFFSRVSLLSVLSGLLVLWVVTLIMVLGLLTLLLAAVWPQGAVWAAHWLLRPAASYVTGMARLLGGSPSLTAAADSPYLMLALAALLVWLTALRQKKEGARRLLPAACGVMALCVLLSGAERLLLTRVSLIGTDSGAAVLIDSRGETCAVNCGLDAAGRNARRLEQQLVRWGKGSLDELLVTSASAHAGGGLQQTRSLLNTGRCIAPADSRAALWADAVYTGEGSLQWGAARVELLFVRGKPCAARILLPHLTLLDLTQAAPVDYLTDPASVRLTGDIVLLGEDFLADAGATELLLRTSGCRAVVCADSAFRPIREHKRSGVGVYSLSRRQSMQLTTWNW